MMPIKFMIINIIISFSSNLHANVSIGILHKISITSLENNGRVGISYKINMDYLIKDYFGFGSELGRLQITEASHESEESNTYFTPYFFCGLPIKNIFIYSNIGYGIFYRNFINGEKYDYPEFKDNLYQVLEIGLGIKLRIRIFNVGLTINELILPEFIGDEASTSVSYRSYSILFGLIL